MCVAYALLVFLSSFSHECIVQCSDGSLSSDCRSIWTWRFVIPLIKMLFIKLASSLPSCIGQLFV